MRLGFFVEELDSFLKIIKAKGLTIHQEASSHPWGYSAVLLDPDGRKVELTERPTLT
ncbi:MAG: VOC family protein [Bacteroidota bacterium]